MRIPPGQNAFTWKPKDVFNKEERREFDYAQRGVAGGLRSARRHKGSVVYGLKSNPDNAPAEYKDLK